MRNRICFAMKAALVICAVCALATISAAQQAPAQQQPFVVHHLNDTISSLTVPIYWIEGGGGNTTVIVGDKGVTVIDTKTTPAGGKEVVDDIAKITDKPITDVILTHSDGDHVNGLASFPMGMTIIAQDNCKAEMEASITAGGRGAAPKDYLPTKTYADKLALKINGVRFELYHWAPAHTSGDTVIYLPDEKLVVSGDILAMNAPDPIIHMEKHGSPAGWIKTTQAMLKFNAGTFIPGHGVLMTKADVEKELAQVQAEDKQVRALVAQGKSLDDVKVALNVPAPAPGGRGPRFASYAETDYQELTASKPQAQ